MKLRRRRRVKAFPQKRSQLGGCGHLPENGVRGFAPPSAFGRTAASPQTRQMRCWPSSERTTNPSSRRKRQDSLSLSLVLFPPKPLRWVSAGVLLGAVIKTPVLHFFGTSMWGWYHYPLAALSVSEQPRAGFISAEKRLSQSGCSAPTNTLFPPAHSAFLAPLCVGWYHYPRRALHAVETLGAQGTRRRIRRFYAAPVLALCGLNLPSSGTHANPAPNSAHSGSRGETRRVLRVDGDDVSGSWIIDTIDPFQADQTVAVALAEGHRNAVSP